MAIISGIDAVVHGEHTTRAWFVRRTGNNPKWAGTGFPQAYHYAKGNEDWTGWFKGWGGKPAVFPGDEFAFIGSADGTKGLSGPVICDKILIRCDKETSQVLQYQVNFSGNGAITEGAVTATDTVITDLPPGAFDLDLRLDDTPEANLRWYQLEISAANRVYGGVTAGWLNRTKGNLNCIASCGLYFEDLANLPVQNAVHEVEFDVNDTEFWAVNWMRVLSRSKLLVAREEQAAQGENANAVIEFGLADENSTLATSIINPATDTKFPYS